MNSTGNNSGSHHRWYKSFRRRHSAASVSHSQLGTPITTDTPPFYEHVALFTPEVGRPVPPVRMLVRANNMDEGASGAGKLDTYHLCKHPAVDPADF